MAELEQHLHRHGLPEFASRLRTALNRCADPDGATPRVDEALRNFLEEAPDALRSASTAAPDRLAYVLATLAASAPFFLPLARRHPAIVLDLAEDNLALPRSRRQLEHRLVEAFSRAAPATPAGDTLRRYKYAELARITVRDLSLDIVPFARTGETLEELSDLADVLLSRALEVAFAEVATTLGPAAWRTPDGTVREPSFLVLGLGKLGSRELNYSSDVDLIYVYEQAHREGGEVETKLTSVAGQDVPPSQYFTRVAQNFGRVVGANTHEGFLYRVDVDLRPEGSRGPLVVPSGAFLRYYDEWAATWERAALLKARPVAGDLRFGWRLLRDVEPMLLRSTMDFQAVAAIKDLKKKIEEAKTTSSGAFNLKLGAGGIRDIESIAQALQLLYGGRMPQIRQRSTRGTLEALRDVGLLESAVVDELLDAYHFFRRTENRLQMVAERQTHVLPSSSIDRSTLGRSLGLRGDDAGAELIAVMETHRDRCRREFARVFPADGPDRVMRLFVHHMPTMLANPVTRTVYENLAHRFADAIDAGANPERALVNLDHFLHGLKGRRFYVELLLDRPELVRRLAALFATSEYLSSYFASYPRLIEPIFDDPKTLLLSPEQLEREFVSLHEAAGRTERDSTEVFLETLRLFHHRQVVNVGLLDIDGRVGRADVEAALTHVSETCVRHALDLAAKQLQGRANRPEGSSFLVIGMGKLGSHEITYGSDLDVIFLYDRDDRSEYALALAHEYFARLAQKLIWALSAPVVTGVCYEVDARLRPSGQQGTLVTSVTGFLRYHETGARVWERQALLRARGVAGDVELCQRFDAIRRGILRTPLTADPAAEIHRIRQRMEGELARETNSRHNFKTGHGGLLDVESIVQLLQLRHGRQHDDLLETVPVADLLERLLALTLLPSEDFTILRDGWEFLQRLSSRLRVVNNRSISDLDEERGDLDTVALTLGYRSPQRSGGARRALLADYTRHTSAIRAVYSKYFGVDVDTMSAPRTGIGGAR